MLKYVFFGAADFAAQILEQLIKANWRPDLVITSQPQPVGRKQKMTQSAVFEIAKKNKLPVWQVPDLKDRSIRNKISEIKPTVGILVALAMIVPQPLIDAFPKGIVNVHPSLLPKWRGPSPIQFALLNGDTDSGVSLMLLDKEIDHGPIIAQEKLTILPEETYPELAKRSAALGAEFLIAKLPEYLAGKLWPAPQDHSQATFCKIIKRSDGQIDWSRPAQEIFNQWRAFTPWPGIFTSWDNKRLKLIKISLGIIESTTPGLVSVSDKKILIGCADYFIEVSQIQLEGGSVLTASDFLNGNATTIGKHDSRGRLSMFSRYPKA